MIFYPCFFFFFLNSLSDLGLSTGTHNWPTRCNRPIHTWKPANSTPMMVGSRFQPPTTETSGSVDESTLQNPIQIDPTGLYIGNTPIFAGMKNFLSFIARYVEIRQDLDRSSQISLKSLIDLVSSFRNLARSSQISASSAQISAISAQISAISNMFWLFSSTPSLTNTNQYPTRPN